MTSEKRRYRRKNVTSRVKIFHAAIGSFFSKTINISNGGILIHANQYTNKININDAVKVIFLNSAKVDIVFNMNIIRNNKEGVGMELLSCEKAGKVFAVSDLRDALRK